MKRFVERVTQLSGAALFVLAAQTGCSSAQRVEPKEPTASMTCALPRAEPKSDVDALEGSESGDIAFEWRDGGFFKRGDWSDATLDVIDIAPAPGTMITPEAVLRARLRYSIDRHPDAHYALYAQFRRPDDTSTFDGSISNTSSPPVDRTADVVDLTFPLAPVVKDAGLTQPIQVKFVLTQYFSSKESVVIAETDYFPLGPS